MQKQDFLLRQSPSSSASRAADWKMTVYLKVIPDFLGAEKLVVLVFGSLWVCLYPLAESCAVCRCQLLWRFDMLLLSRAAASPRSLCPVAHDEYDEFVSDEIK